MIVEFFMIGSLLLLIGINGLITLNDGHETGVFISLVGTGFVALAVLLPG